MTPTLAAIRFESAYLLCNVNTIDAHLMSIQFDSLRMRIETRLQRASCERALILNNNSHNQEELYNLGGSQIKQHHTFNLHICQGLPVR